MSRAFSFRGLALLLLTLLIANVVTVSVGSESTTLTVANRTEHYVHVFIDDEHFLYVAPDRSVTRTTEIKPSMLVSVFYAPGQGISGGLVDSTVTLPFRSARESCDCSGNDSHGDCVVTPATGGTARLEVRVGDMQPLD